MLASCLRQLSFFCVLFFKGRLLGLPNTAATDSGGRDVICAFVRSKNAISLNPSPSATITATRTDLGLRVSAKERLIRLGFAWRGEKSGRSREIAFETE